MKIGIADPQARVRFGLRILLEQQPGWIVIGEAEDSQELLGLVRVGCPDLVLIDWDLPDLPAVSLLRLLRAQFPRPLLITMSGKQEFSQVAKKAGADAFASKTEPPDKLLAIIRELYARKLKLFEE